MEEGGTFRFWTDSKTCSCMRNSYFPIRLQKWNKKSRVAKSSKNGKSAGQIIHRQLDVSKVTQLSCLVGHSSGLKIQKSVKGNPHSQSSMGCHAQLCNLSSTQRLSISYTMELSSWWSCISVTVHSTGEHAALHMFLKYLPCFLHVPYSNSWTMQKGREAAGDTDRPAHAHERSTKVCLQQTPAAKRRGVWRREEKMGKSRTTMHMMYIVFFWKKLYS